MVKEIDTNKKVGFLRKNLLLPLRIGVIFGISKIRRVQFEGKEWRRLFI